MLRDRGRRWLWNGHLESNVTHWVGCHGRIVTGFQTRRRILEDRHVAGPRLPSGEVTGDLHVYIDGGTAGDSEREKAALDADLRLANQG